MLTRVLKRMKSRAVTTPKWQLLLKALRLGAATPASKPYLERLQLIAPKALQDRIARTLLIEELQQEGIN